MDAKRLFIAVDISEETRALAHEHINQLRAAFKNARAGWTAPEKLHITLKFLGDVEAARIERLVRAINDAASRSAPFGLRIAGTGLFPSERRPRVLWLGIEDPDAGLAGLRRQIEAACRAAGFPEEPRPFKPHLTIARIRDPRTAAPLARAHLSLPFTAGRFTVTHITLYQSRLLPSGSEYTKLATATFK